VKSKEGVSDRLLARIAAHSGAVKNTAIGQLHYVPGYRFFPLPAAPCCEDPGSISIRDLRAGGELSGRFVARLHLASVRAVVTGVIDGSGVKVGVLPTRIVRTASRLGWRAATWGRYVVLQIFSLAWYG